MPLLHSLCFALDDVPMCNSLLWDFPRNYKTAWKPGSPQSFLEPWASSVHLSSDSCQLDSRPSFRVNMEKPPDSRTTRSPDPTTPSNTLLWPSLNFMWLYTNFMWYKPHFFIWTMAQPHKHKEEKLKIEHWRTLSFKVNILSIRKKWSYQITVIIYIPDHVFALLQVLVFLMSEIMRTIPCLSHIHAP